MFLANVATRFSLTLAATAGLVLAQDATPPAQTAPQQTTDGGWHRMQPSATSTQTTPVADTAANEQQAAAPAIPGQLTLKPGTYITIRLNDFISSDRNQVGDPFSATLDKPIVVDGVVVAQRGQNISGRVAEAKKAGRVSGTSRLGIQITDLPIVDGQQVPVQSELVTRNGSTSVGRDVAAAGTTTAVGAAIGGAVNGGVGAGVGAGAGLVAGLAGVLLTRGNPTVLYPEQVLTFKITAPVTISTERGLAAFRYVEPADYNTAGAVPAGPRLVRRVPVSPYYGGVYPYYPYGYGFYPGFGVYFRGGYGYRGGFRR